MVYLSPWSATSFHRSIASSATKRFSRSRKALDSLSKRSRSAVVRRTDELRLLCRSWEVLDLVSWWKSITFSESTSLTARLLLMSIVRPNAAGFFLLSEILENVTDLDNSRAAARPLVPNVDMLLDCKANVLHGSTDLRRRCL